MNAPVLHPRPPFTDETTEVPTTGAVPLTDRPLRVIDLVDGAFAALRYRPRVIILSILWIVLPFALLEGWASRGVLGGGSLVSVLNDPTLAQEASEATSPTTTFATYLIDWSRISLIGVATAYLVNSWADGRDPGPREVIGFTVRRLRLWLATFALAKLAILVGLAAVVVPGVALALAFTLVSPILAVEGTGPVATLRRAWTMMRQRTLQVLGLYVACAVVGGFVSNALTTIPSIAALVIGTDVAWPLVSVASIISASLLAPFNGAAMTLMYHDIRFRSEGLDLIRRADRVFPASQPIEVGGG